MTHLLDLKLSQLFGIHGERPDPLIAMILEPRTATHSSERNCCRDLHDRGIDPLDRDVTADVELPGSVQRLILDRLDRLPVFERSILRFCSAAGKRLPHSWLAGMAPHLVRSPTFGPAVVDLLDAAFLEMAAPPEVPTYVFATATLRDVIYESLGQSTRREYHRDIARFLETLPTPPVELLVYHYRLADRATDELRHLPAAGEQALKVGAFADRAGFHEKRPGAGPPGTSGSGGDRRRAQHAPRAGVRVDPPRRASVARGRGLLRARQ